MRISKLMACAAVMAMLTAATAPAPAHAQLGKLLKKAVKQKLVDAVIEKVGGAAGGQADTAAIAAAAAGVVGSKPGGNQGAPQAGPKFSEYLLEITPELLDRFEKGIAADLLVRQQIAGLLGKQLAPEAYRECSKAVMSSPAAQKVYLEAGDLANGDTTYAHIQKASQELAMRFDKLVEPLCGLDAIKADKIRQQHAGRLEAAAPGASGLTVLQLSLLKERIVPLCAAIETLAEVAGEARIPTASSAIYWVYTRGEVAAMQPRCRKLAEVLKTAL